jgi:DNA replication protein DnaC
MTLAEWETEALAIQDAEKDRQRERVELQAKAAENVRRVLEQDARKQQEEWTGLLERLVKKAEEATGMTREEMLAAPSQPPTPTAFEIRRETVANRGVPELHLRAVVDKPPDECDALSAVRTFIASADARTFLVLSGTVGTRKTGSAAWALSQRSGLFLKADDLGRVAGARDEESVETYRSCKRVGLLILDDVGAEYADEKGWFVRALTAVVDCRYENLLKTVMTTNLDAAAFKARYGERLTDRIRGAGTFVALGGVSVRGREPGEDDE